MSFMAIWFPILADTWWPIRNERNQRIFLGKKENSLKYKYKYISILVVKKCISTLDFWLNLFYVKDADRLICYLSSLHVQ